MTLSRQLYAVIILLLLAVLGRMFWISVDNTRSYLTGQMQTQTANAVDALGMSLQPAMAAKDMALMATKVNAVFDHGYYRRLVLTDMHGKLLLKRVNSEPVKDVPAWFIHLLPIHAPSVTATLTSGWMQYGKLTLEAHPGHAYVNLWDSFRQLLLLALWTFLVSAIVVMLLVRGMLKPLAAIEEQALAISRREFPINEHKPWTREFRHVVQAMNRMTEKVRDMIQGLSERAEELQRQSRSDALTGLPNRNGFMPAFAAQLAGFESGSSGLFVLLKLDDFATFNNRVGYQVGDRLLQDVATVLKQYVERHDGALAGRIGGVDFALVLPRMQAEQIDAFCREFRTQLDALQGSGDEACRMVFGATGYAADHAIPAILGRADTALGAARTSAQGYSVESDTEHARGNIDWQGVVDDVLQHERITLVAQPIRSVDGKPVYREVLARILDAQGEVIPPASFMPMAERLGRMDEVDGMVLQLAAAWLGVHADAHLGVNLSSATLRLAATSDWLQDRLAGVEEASDIAGRLLIEITEHAAMQDAKMTAAFIDKAHALGLRVVMERFGSGLASFHTLRRLKLDFIKLDGSYVRGLADSDENRFFLRTLLDIAHGLDIRVIAEQVETAADLAALQEMGIDALQGYHIDKPEALNGD